MRIRPFLALGFTSLLAFGAWRYHQKSERALAAVDLDRVCQAQRSFLETQRLMKTVPTAELEKERALHFDLEVKSGLVREALREPAGARRKALARVAEEAGRPDWRCPAVESL